MKFSKIHIKVEAEETIKKLTSLHDEAKDTDDMKKFDYVDNQVDQVMDRWIEKLKN